MKAKEYNEKDEDKKKKKESKMAKKNSMEIFSRKCWLPGRPVGWSEGGGSV
jgi:hypothetical protein